MHTCNITNHKHDNFLPAVLILLIHTILVIEQMLILGRCEVVVIVIITVISVILTVTVTNRTT